MNYPGDWPLSSSSWIIMPGQLVRVRRNCLAQREEIGIIIECVCPDFGIGYDDEYLVLVDGIPQRLRTFMIYPIENYSYNSAQYERSKYN